MKDHASKIICVKSTIPPGTMRRLYSFLEHEPHHSIDLVYNPEFMREGCALRDIYTNPIVLGGESQEAVQVIERLYQGFLSDDTPVIKTTYETAEMIKYSWNAFSAIRIAYVNELALLCREVNADITTVIQGFALSEQLLPTAALQPGPGFGGSCLPKDTASFAHMMQGYGFESSLIHQAIGSNQAHIGRLIQDINALLGQSRSQKIVTLLGLSFKANTNDIRNAPSLAIIKALREAGVMVQVYDPQAMDNVRQLFPDIYYYDSPYDAVEGSDCVVVLAEWDEIKKMDLERVGALCRKKILMDTRNIFDTAVLKKYGFSYMNMGSL